MIDRIEAKRLIHILEVHQYDLTQILCKDDMEFINKLESAIKSRLELKERLTF